MRILAACRLSRKSDESTSLERQEEAIRHWAAIGGHEVVEVTTDADVSGVIPPRERPGLGKWFEPAQLTRWDCIAVWKIDRLSRSIFDFTDLYRWAEKEKKVIVSVTEGIDFSTPVGRMIGTILALFADFERERMRERRADHARKARQEARWDGRAIPPGYRKVRVDQHWELEPDPPQVEMITRWAAMAAGGMPARQIGIREGTTGHRVLAILRNPGLRGFVMHLGKPVRLPDGTLVRREPVLDDETWARLQAALDAQGKGNGMRRQTGAEALLYRVARCGKCRAPLYIMRRKGYKPGYRHKDHGPGTCTASMIQAQELHEAVSRQVMAELGDLPVVERVEIPGQDHHVAISRLEAELEELDQARRDGDVTARSWGRMAAAIEAELDRLRSLPVVAPGIGWRPTKETHRQRWESLDEQGRNAYLREQKIVAYVVKEGKELSGTVEFGLRDEYLAECNEAEEKVFTTPVS